MIHPDMATMLSVILTDAALTPAVARQVLSHAVERSFNRISIDGDTSTNDTVFLLANGAAGSGMLKPGRPGWSAFSRSLGSITEELAHMIVSDGEGAEHCITIYVEKAKNKKAALSVARTIATSPLVKTAMYGADPNWGRILAAAGRSGVAVNPGRIDIYFGPYRVCRNGMVDSFPEKALKKLLQKKEVEIRVVLHQGAAAEKFLFSDLTDGYIHINAHYST